MKKDDFAEYLIKEELKPTTINNHIRNLAKYKNIDMFDLEIEDMNIVLTLKEADINNSQKLTIGSTMSKYLQYLDKPNNNIIEFIKSINDELKKKYNKRNKEAKYQYTKKDILKQTNKFYKDKEYKSYVVSYLVYYFNVRNTDLNITICKSKKLAKNEKQNYLILRKNSVIYHRNDYKTSGTYGSKFHEIKAKKFIDSIKQLIKDDECTKLFDTFSNSTNMVKQFTPFGLKTSDIVKIVLAEDNTLHKASKISKNRGTALETLEQSYNLKV